MNPAAENLLGISEKRAAGEPLLKLVGDDTEFEDILARVIRTGDHYANELTLPHTEVHAEERIIDCRVSPIAAGRAAILVEMTDVTRRSKITRENALLIQHGAGRQMIRQLAHEIKNPLGGIRGAAQLLAKQLDSAELKEYTDVVISETDRLAGLVDTLLGPGGPPRKEPHNIHELLEYVVRIISAEKHRALSIRRDYDPGLPDIRLDRDQMVQALLNIVQNAVLACGRRPPHARDDQLHYRRYATSCHRHHRHRGRRPRDSPRPAGLGVLSAGNEPPRRDRARSAGGAGTHQPTRRPH